MSTFISGFCNVGCCVFITSQIVKAHVDNRENKSDYSALSGATDSSPMIKRFISTECCTKTNTPFKYVFCSKTWQIREEENDVCFNLYVYFLCVQHNIPVGTGTPCRDVLYIFLTEYLFIIPPPTLPLPIRSMIN